MSALLNSRHLGKPWFAQSYEFIGEIRPPGIWFDTFQEQKPFDIYQVKNTK